MTQLRQLRRTLSDSNNSTRSRICCCPRRLTEDARIFLCVLVQLILLRSCCLVLCHGRWPLAAVTRTLVACRWADCPHEWVRHIPGQLVLVNWEEVTSIRVRMNSGEQELRPASAGARCPPKVMCQSSCLPPTMMDVLELAVGQLHFLMSRTLSGTLTCTSSETRHVPR